MISTNLNPLIQWVGGKRRLVPELLRYMPENFNMYYEPFVGGGALWLAVQPQRAVINDLNAELINLYQTTRDFPRELIDQINFYIQHNSKEFYLAIRGLDREERWQTMDDITKAARFVYLITCGFNGLYRVNRKGQVNTPYGRPQQFDCENLIAVSQFLNTSQVTFTQNDFTDAVASAKSGDFVYLDPPYQPVSKTASFTGYTKQQFDFDDQIRVRDLFFDLQKRGVKVMLSNSDTPEIRELYAEANIHQVELQRLISAKAATRKKVNELVITNY